MILKRIDPPSVGRVFGCISALLGLPVGIVCALAAVLDASAMHRDRSSGFLIAILLIVAMPILLGIVGMIKGVVAALLYNFAAARVGGIELQFEQHDDGKVQ